DGLRACLQHEMHTAREHDASRSLLEQLLDVRDLDPGNVVRPGLVPVPCSATARPQLHVARPREALDLHRAPFEMSDPRWLSHHLLLADSERVPRRNLALKAAHSPYSAPSDCAGAATSGTCEGCSHGSAPAHFAASRRSLWTSRSTSPRACHTRPPSGFPTV